MEREGYRENRNAGAARSSSADRGTGAARSSTSRSTGAVRSPRPTRSGGARARAIARRRRQRRRRRMLLGSLLLAAVLLVGSITAGVLHWRDTKARQELAVSGVEALDQANYEEAIRLFDEAVEGKKRIGDFEENVLLFRADAECRQKDYTAALHTCELLLEADPENPEAKAGAALCLAENGEYEKALALNAKNGSVYSRMAAAQMAAGQYEEAGESIRLGKAAGEEEAMQALAFNEAVLCEYQGDFAKALELMESYTAQYGTDEEAERELTFLRTRVTAP